MKLLVCAFVFGVHNFKFKLLLVKDIERCLEEGGWRISYSFMKGQA